MIVPHHALLALASVRRRRQASEAQHQIVQVPPRLTGARPRPVRLTGTGVLIAAIGTLMLAAAPLAAVWLHTLAVRDGALRRRIESEGVRVAATVTALTRTRGDNASYFATFEYAAGNTGYSKRASVRRNVWRSLHVGEPLQVRYLPSSPEQSWIIGTEPRGVFWAIPVVAVLLMFAAAMLWRGLRRESLLLSEGRATLGRVVDVKRVSHAHGSRDYRIRYEFSLPSGAQRSGRCTSRHGLPQIGTTICVLYDPDNPKRSANYPLALVRPA